MTKVKIDIDTEDGSRSHGPHDAFRFVAGTRIGVVSSISLPQALEKAFKGGVDDGHINVKIKDKVTYKKGNKQKLIAEIIKFNNTADLIVTVGGSVSYAAAVDAPATKPFLSLVGSVPTGAPDNFKGGVSLQSYEANADRIALLVEKTFQPSEIGLFCNPNSEMNGAEEADWKFQIGANNQIFHGGVNAQGENDASTYSGDFGSIPAAIKALVISADPFFQDTREQLITAANAWGGYVCYPALEYANRSGTKPTHTKATLFGPALTDAYSLLGQLSVVVLKSGAALPVLRLGNTKEDL
jgi:hypothetical protein